MMQQLRIYVGIFLSLAVVLTAHSAAAIRGTQDATGQMVICTGTGPVAIYVDSEGKPASAPHYCPDCVMHILDLAAAAALSAPQPADVADILDLSGVPAPVLSSCETHAFARGPPSSV